MQFVVFSDDWGRRPSAPQHLFAVLARRHEVLWVEPAGLRRPRLTASDARRSLAKLRGFGPGTAAAVEDPWLPQPPSLRRLVPPVVPAYGVAPIRLLNDAAMTRAVNNATASLGFDRPVVVSTIPTMAGVVGKLGESCAIPAPPPALDANSEDEMGQVAPLMIQQLVMSLACDITRVATLQMSSGANNIRFPFLYSYADDHVLSHAGPSDATSIAEWSLRQHWYSSQFAYLLGLMDAIPEGSGSLLDNSLVLWCSELGRGSTHSHNDIPFILAGGAGGTVAPGRYLQFADRNHNDLLVAILNAMGVAATSFGDPDYSVDGALAGILS